MNWKNVHRDNLPGNYQEVLLAVDGIYYITVFDAKNGIFRQKDDMKTHFAPSESSLMYWQDKIDSPSNVQQAAE